MKKPAVAYTFVSDDYYEAIGTPILLNSFKRYHPDIPFVVFRQKDIERVFSTGVHWLTAKAAFARLLTDEYELVVNMDADHVVTARMAAVFDDPDYDAGAPSNFNDYENMSVGNVTAEMYLNAGMVASRSPRFWEIYDFNSRAHWRDHRSNENTVLNLIWYNDPETMALRLKIFDRQYGYYGCKALNREPEFYVEHDQLWCRGERVFCYHHAKGGGALPKLRFDRMKFTPEVAAWLKKISSPIMTSHIITAAGDRLEIDLSHEGARRHFEWPGSYTEEILRQINDAKFYDALFKGRHDLFFLDIGANIGLVSLYAQDVCRQVVAIEPSDHFPLLCKLTNAYPNIVRVQVALHSVNGPVALSLCDANSTGHSTSVHVGGRQMQVKGQTLSTIVYAYMLTEKVDVVKVDVEGAELGALTEAQISQLLPVVEAYYVEMHATNGLSVKQVHDLMVQRFETCGYQVKDAIYPSIIARRP